MLKVGHSVLFYFIYTADPGEYYQIRVSAVFAVQSTANGLDQIFSFSNPVQKKFLVFIDIFVSNGVYQRIGLHEVKKRKKKFHFS